MKIQIVPASQITKEWQKQYEDRRKVSLAKRIERLAKAADKLGFKLMPKEPTS
jgi:hypothetical protein